ncbi:uncharacterized protein LOC130721575 isoform X2 [Lotus japonicus]|uniref:uncharacterized protein LOC130721575 isoform X2 n=1 Tax=Lotus japonicus TaxID=34305 RepID=UPI00258B40B6|nr:uncharacterized protein LOC130721575 isoform X2 [Lotus japonicus]
MTPDAQSTWELATQFYNDSCITLCNTGCTTRTLEEVMDRLKQLRSKFRRYKSNGSSRAWGPMDKATHLFENLKMTFPKFPNTHPEAPNPEPDTRTRSISPPSRTSTNPFAPYACASAWTGDETVR